MPGENLTARFKVDKVTKNTNRFSEDVEGIAICTSIYVRHEALAQIGNPQAIQVTLEPIKE